MTEVEGPYGGRESSVEGEGASEDGSTAIRAAVVQMNSGEDVARNLRVALDLVDRAAERGARLVVLPEKFHYLGDPERVAEIRESLDGPVLRACAAAASRHGIHLVAGSIWEGAPGDERPFNTSVVFGPTGERLAAYRKIHMFDVDVGGRTYRESDECRAGEEVVAVRLPDLGSDRQGDTGGPAGDEAVILGLSVCYDVRFPELYRGLVDLGARIVSVPADFTMTTGRDHWEVLLRARAVEDQVFVLAANQTGTHGRGLEAYGRSMIVDPWGLVLARVPDGEGVAVADLDLAAVDRVRSAVPALMNRAPAAYGHRRLV